MKLTKERIDATTAKDGDVWLWDKDVPGFGVRVQPSGRKTYVVRYRNANGQQRKHTIGRVVDMPPTQARDIARRTFAAISSGSDPAEAKRENRASPTVRDLFDMYYNTHSLPYKKPGSAAQDKIAFEVHIIPALGNRKVRDLTFSDVQRLHGAMHKTKVAANRTIAALSTAYTVAQKMGWIARGLNPCKDVKRYPERGRSRVISQTEIQAIYSAINSGQFPDGFVRFVKLLFLTGCRKREILNALVDWVDWERGLLCLPDSKTGPKIITLSDEALLLIAERKGCHAIVQGVRTDRPLESVYRHWSRMLAVAGLENIHIHDVRHTVGSMAHRAGLTQRQVADLLGHRRLATTEKYIHGNSLDRRDAARLVARLVA